MTVTENKYGYVPPESDARMLGLSFLTEYTSHMLVTHPFRSRGPEIEQASPLAKLPTSPKTNSARVGGGEGLPGAGQPLSWSDWQGFASHLPTWHFFFRRRLLKMPASETQVKLATPSFYCKCQEVLRAWDYSRTWPASWSLRPRGRLAHQGEGQGPAPGGPGTGG